MYMKPRDIKEYLDRFVIKHNDAKRILSTVLFSHDARSRSDDPMPAMSTLLIGDTGTGKSYMIQRLSELWDAPVHTIDCSQLTPSGYKGENLGDQMSQLKNLAAVKQSEIKKDLQLPKPGSIIDYELAQKLQQAPFAGPVIERSIVVFDEIDKLMSNSESVQNFKEGVQREMLRMLNGDPITVHDDNTRSSFVLNTKKMLFFFSGAFVGLRDMVNDLNKNKLGFTSDEEKDLKKDLKRDVEPLLTRYGLIPELIGRVQNIVFLDALETDDYVEILTRAEDGVLDKYFNLFESANLDLFFDEGAYKTIAEQASKSPTGARSIHKTLNKLLTPILYEHAGDGLIININGDLSYTTEKIQDVALDF